MTPENQSVPPTEPIASGPRRGRRRAAATALVAATLAAAGGVAVAGTFAGAQPGRKASGAATKQATVRVLVKRGRRGETGPPGADGDKGAAGPKGTTGPPGAPATDVARSLSINWKGAPGANGGATSSLPGIGRLDLTCTPDTQELRITPGRADARTVATIDTFQSASVDHARRSSQGDPIVVPLPVNGMITGVFSIEPINGDGGPGPAPVTLTLSSELKLNAQPGDPADFNFCYVAAQLLQAGS
jgi:hypothetical protein